MSKIVSVFGATGSQGGAVVNSLLKDGTFKVRALTRNTQSQSAKHLKSLGCEVVKCDVTDSKKEIEQALRGSYGVFLVTFSAFLFEKEAIYGKTVVDAALEAGVQHFVFSSLPNSKKITSGKIVIEEFDLKYEIEEYLRDISKKNPSFKSSFVIPPFYMQNFDQANPLFTIRKNKDGNYYLEIAVDPKSKHPFDLIDINDMGPVVVEILKDPKKYSNLSIFLNGDALSSEQICEILSKETGKPIILQYIPPKEYEKVGNPIVAKMLDFCNNYGFDDNFTLASKITKLTSFKEYLQKNTIHLK
ncbi:hypothetical protein DICPUDRAFT_26791 [Dictyostelium purpureum]|uniref:NmrA-like family domain-containing protein 1 n=1 Tax=Dictyostelium purpureum TaxID=5786 RepID=F0Z991_DICPU|nr:uncharacterized protein DICPUDRAFT_26791 [Dictyostelium purpureum]EGC39511.1 hypothetical protein DICPUDRAFT_26791 [Dictyostelium purpureum]|eukprot:XP_003283958.1 hypothetical protein DICPUDRAFT_26791 [Dictyostelium purpureum]